MLRHLRRIAKSSPAVVLVVLVFAPSALAQASRTWVSGVGDDANPCSRTAPCKSFAGAISKTMAGGEISVLDPGGFGALTITKAITIDGGGFGGGVLTSGPANGIVVNAGANDKVILRNLDINGLNSAFTGVLINSAKSVSIEHSEIYDFSNSGVNLAPSSGVIRVNINNSSINDNAGDGVFVAPNGGTGIVTLTNDTVDRNACGAVTGSYGPSGDFTTNCGTAGTASGVVGRGSIGAFNSTFNNNTAAGVFAEGTRASDEIGADEVLYNATGLLAPDGGTISSFSNNYVFGNTTNGAPTVKVTPLLRRARRHH